MNHLSVCPGARKSENWESWQEQGTDFGLKQLQDGRRKSGFTGMSLDDPWDCTARDILVEWSCC